MADYDLYLYRQGDWANPVAQSASYGYGVGERILHTPTQTGRYYIRVHPWGGSYSDTDPYTLAVRYE